MRTIKYIEKQELLKIYPDGVKGFSHTGSMQGRVSLPERCEVVVLHQDGPYALVHSRHQKNGNQNSRFIVPSELVKSVEQDYANRLFAPVLDKHHPGQWQWRHDRLYIWYPKLTLTNSLNQKHDVYDLVVRLDVSVITGTLISSSIYGTRVNFTPTEKNVGYIHSHLHRCNARYLEFTKFCLGSGPFVHILVDLNKDVVTAEEFEVLLIQLRSYLEWESVEGQPYFSIRNLNNSQSGVRADWNGNADNIETLGQLLLLMISRHSNGQSLFTPIGEISIDLNPDLFFEIEKSIIPHLTTDSLNDWSLTEAAYIKGGSTVDQGIRIRHVDELRILIQDLAIPIRDIEEHVVTEQNNIIKRIHPELLNTVLKYINNALLMAYKPIKQEYAQRSISEEQTEGNSIQGISIPDNSTTQGMSTEQGVEWTTSVSSSDWQH